MELEKKCDALWEKCGIDKPTKGSTKTIIWCLSETQLIMRSRQIGAASAWVTLGLQLREEALRRKENMALQKLITNTGNAIIETIRTEADTTRNRFALTEDELTNRLEAIRSSVSNLDARISFMGQQAK